MYGIDSRVSQQNPFLRIGTDLGDLEGFDLASVRDMRPNAQVDHRTATVHGGGGTIRNLRLNELHFVLVVLW